MLAWLADTYLLRCDLGNALRTRLQNVEFARKLLEGSPGNNNFKIRYAFSLTGLSTVAIQVGLVETAIDDLTEARDILGQLSLMDPSNLDLRFGYLSREFYVADLRAEHDRLAEAIFRMEAVDQAFRQALETENYLNQRRYSTWIRFLLARSDMAWRSQDAVAAATFLADALDHLDRMLQADSDVTSLMDVLVRARFQMWQKEGRDLYSSGRFAALKNIDDTADRTCNTRANRVRQAILTGDEDSARRITASLLESGYYEPGFIRVCSRYGFCERKGWVS